MIKTTTSDVLPKPTPVLQKMAAATVVATFFVASLSSYYEKQPTLNPRHIVNLDSLRQNKPVEHTNLDSYYAFDKKAEVLDFIKNKQDVNLLLQALPKLVADIFGETKMTLSVYDDYEEDWQNLYVEIETNLSFDTILPNKKKLIALIDADKTIESALHDVTLSFV